MAEIHEHAFNINPIPGGILNSSLYIEKASNSFLDPTQLLADEWRGSKYLVLLADGMLSSDTNVCHVHGVIYEAIRTSEVKTIQSIRIIPARVW
jgi:hypothetical protein